MTGKNRVDTSALFEGMIGKKEEQSKNEKVSVPVEQKNLNLIKETPAKSGRKANKEKNIQVSIYLTPNQAKELRLQDAEKEKETDKSAIARTGIDIVLALSNEEYAAMKRKAAVQGVTPGQIVKEALAKFL